MNVNLFKFYNNHNQGNYCMKQRNTKLTQEEFDERMKNINPNIKVLSKYTRRKDKTDCICLICDTRWTTTFDGLLEKKGCPKCAIKKMKQCQPQSNEEFLSKFNNSGNKNVIILDKYKNSSTKLHCKCKKCNNEWETLPTSLLKGHGCPKCGHQLMKEKERKTHEQFIKEFNEVGNQNIEILGKYISCTHKIKVRCKKCGRVWEMSPIKLLYAGQGCSSCYRKECVGENHPNWNPNKTQDERILERHYMEYYDFVNKVFERDNYICQITGQVGGALVVHHLNGYNWDIENRTNVDNGITLSKEIHKKFHKIYGYGDNTKEQFLDFVHQLYKQKEITDDGYNLLLKKLK